MRAILPQGGAAENDALCDGAADSSVFYNQRLITLRWLAAAGMIGLTLLSVSLFDLALHSGALTLLGVWIAAYNGILVIASRRITRIEPLISAQVILDWLSVSILVHFTGGITSPALAFYFLHVIVVTILLPGQSPYAYVGLVIVLLTVGSWLEAQGAVAHYPVFRDLSETLYQSNTFILWQIAFLGSALIGTAYLTRSILAGLRRRERKIIEIATQNAKANAALVESERQRMKFVHMVTHELRSPVVAAQSLIRVLLGGLTGALTDQQTDMLHRLSRRLDALLILINDLLALQASRAAVTLKPVTVQPLITLVVDDARIEAAEKQVALSCSCGSPALTIMATEEGIVSIASNLIGNAVKYTPAGGSISVRLCREGEVITFAVTDTGIGIPASALAHLGEEFFRAENAHTSGIVGTGLGLATVTSLVKQFGGVLSVQSEVGKGSTFTITFPPVRDN